MSVLLAEHPLPVPSARPGDAEGSARAALALAEGIAAARETAAAGFAAHALTRGALELLAG